MSRYQPPRAQGPAVAVDTVQTTSIVWVNPKAYDHVRKLEKMAYHEMRRRAAKCGFITSPALPNSLRNWVIYRIDVLQEQAADLRKTIAQIQEQRRLQKEQPELAVAGLVFEGRRVSSIGMPQWGDFGPKNTGRGHEFEEEEDRVRELLGEELFEEL